MRILFLSPTGACGGAEKVLLSVMTALRHEPGLSLHLLSLNGGPLVEHARDLGVSATVLRLPAAWEALGDSSLAKEPKRRGMFGAAWRHMFSHGWESARFLGRLRHTLRRLDPDLIHSNGIKTHALAWLARPRRAAVLWHVHDFYGSRSWGRRLLELPARRLAGAVAVSQAVAEDFGRLWPKVSTRVIANAIDVETFCPGPADSDLLDRLAGLETKAPCLRIGLVATYARWKGHEVFLKAAARLLSACPQLAVRFYIIGAPIYRTRGSQFDIAELRQISHDLGLGEHIGFIGFRSDVANIYRALDVVVHASTAPEPFGLTIIEAMACGRAVIASMAGGAAKIVTPGEDALGVPPGDVVALAEAMRTLAEDAALRERLGRNARQTAVTCFDEKRLGQQWLEVYRRCFSRARPREVVLAAGH